MKKVSILVPVYGVEKYIEKCARSLFEQTYREIEYVFVDDCSPDNSISVLKTVLKDFPTRQKSVNVICHKTNRGLAAARNTALMEAHGHFIFHMDSDDYLDGNTIEMLVCKAEETGADIVTCDYNMIFENHTRTSKSWIRENKNEYIRALLTRRTSFNLSGKLIKKELFTENDIHSIEGLNQGEDYSTYPRVVYFADKCAYVELPLYQYVQYKKDSYTHIVDDEGRKQIISAAKILIDFFSQTEVVKNDPYLLSDIKFYNQTTLFMVSPYSRYKEILDIFPNIPSMNNNKHSGVLKLYNYCIQKRMCRVIWIMTNIKIWLKK